MPANTIRPLLHYTRTPPRPQVERVAHSMSPHAHSRSEQNPRYKGQRAPVPNDKVPWSVTWDGYRPIEFTFNGVLTKGVEQGWADPADQARPT